MKFADIHGNHMMIHHDFGDHLLNCGGGMCHILSFMIITVIFNMMTNENNHDELVS